MKQKLNKGQKKKTMNNNIREIDSIIFGIYTSEEIMNMSVCKIDNPGKNGIGTVYDPRMGPINSLDTCQTCKNNANNCYGHFGHIEFNEPIVHPLFYKRVLNFLNCFCMNCYHLILQKDQILLSGLNKYKGETRFNKILEKLKKIDICCHPTGEINEEGENELCGKVKPKIKFITADNSFVLEYNENISKTSVVLTTLEIKKIFDNISLDEIELLGINSRLSHPSNFIISVLPVLPPSDRPYVQTDNKICDDDLTNQYIEIIKINNKLSNIPKVITNIKENYETKKQRYMASLRFRVLTTFNNSQSKAKHTTNGRPIKGIKERLTGKGGQIRSNVLGKRCDYTARTVIGPEPTLRLEELGIPHEIANILTVPVKVTSFNIIILQKMINEGKIKSLTKPDGKINIDLKRFRRGTRLLYGDIIYRGDSEIIVKNKKEIVQVGDRIKRNGKFLTNIKPSNRQYKISLGWTVHRPLQDNDYVLLNRQPTLHKASMMAMKIKIKPYKTLRMNLAITKPFNADFDGDEMNIHVPQSLEAQVELKYLSIVQSNLISHQSSKPNIAIVQDSLLGAYRMTKGNNKITKGQFFNIAMKLYCPPWSEYKSFSTDGMMSTEEIMDKIQHIRRILKEKGKRIQCFNGHGIISLFLPKDFIYEKRNDKNPDQPIVKIWRGVFYEGTLDKSIIGSAHNAIHSILNKEYGTETASHFIDSIQFVTNEYLLINGFTIGLKDCLISQHTNDNGITKEDEIRDAIQKCYIEAEFIKKSTSHPNIREIRINASLGKAKDIGLRIAKNTLRKDNNFLSTVNSGSKGDFFNIAQITGLLGQQNLKGRRIPLLLNNGRRSIPHYPFEKLEPEMEYESRGFIDRGFLRGLKPRQFFFHAMSGREGICDTAMGTATSGYMQRRIIKLTEDMKVQYDGSIRDIQGKIYQLSYGQLGFDSSCTVQVKNKQRICDISRIVTKLNTKHKLKIQKLQKRRRK